MFLVEEFRNYLTSYECALLAEVFHSQKQGQYRERYSKSTGTTKELSGNPMFELFLDLMKGEVEKIVGEQIVPTYAFARQYYEGTYLNKHTDRYSCVYTVSVTLEQTHGEEWPLKYEIEDKECQVACNVGDIVVLRGCEITHWREPLPSGSQTQLFLHFVPKRKEYRELFFDGRESLFLDLKTAKLIESEKDRDDSNFNVLRSDYFEAVKMALEIMQLR